MVEELVLKDDKATLWERSVGAWKQVLLTLGEEE